MVTAVAALTALVVMLKVAVLALAGTVTVEDSCAAALLLARLTTGGGTTLPHHVLQ